MAEHSTIEWTEATWNPITGCSVVSPGCTNCYAMRFAGRRGRHLPSRAGLTTMSKAGPVWNGQVRFNAEWLDQPLRWKRPRMIFVCAHGDLFHESVPDEWIDRIFGVMALCPQHTFQVLTKRAKRMREYMTGLERTLAHLSTAQEMARQGLLKQYHRLQIAWPLPNVWLGVSAEDQTRADERIPDLLATPAAVRWVSAEPLIGPVDLRRWLQIDWQCGYCRGFFTGKWKSHCPACGREGGWSRSHAFNGRHMLTRPGFAHDRGSGLDWIVAGGESGPGARPMHPDWARSIRDQCAAAGVPFFMKQWGAWHETYSSKEWDGPTHWLMPNGTMRAIANADNWRAGAKCIRNVGKARAGRLLDGIEHNAMPEIAR
jgi:protein gp37